MEAHSNQTGVGYNAGAGYDLVTGIGVPHVQALAQALVGVQTTPLAQTVAPAQNATFTVASNTAVNSYQWQRLAIGSATWRRPGRRCHLQRRRDGGPDDRRRGPRP